MTTALDRVKQATVQLRMAAATSRGVGRRAETTSTKSSETIRDSNLFWTRSPPATRLNSRPLSTAGSASGAVMRTTLKDLRPAKIGKASGA